eukprot:1781171-Amphidinium_carterae.1
MCPHGLFQRGLNYPSSAFLKPGQSLDLQNFAPLQTPPLATESPTSPQLHRFAAILKAHTHRTL